jgi:ATP-dependent helicase/nuclease subunit A
MIAGIVEYGEVKEFFIQRPGRKILREQEFVDEEGRLSRMDRLVLDRDRVVVIDWKTGKGKEAEKEYETQMRNYLKILEEIYPGKNIEGMIVYVDLKEVKWIH